MKLTVQLFSLLAERAGTRTLEVNVTFPLRASVLLDELTQRYDVVAEMRGAVRLAVNREYADADSEIKEGDEIALITPTSGG